jgi:hypothetical protein
MVCFYNLMLFHDDLLDFNRLKMTRKKVALCVALAGAGFICQQNGAQGCWITFTGECGIIRIKKVLQGHKCHPFR